MRWLTFITTYLIIVLAEMGDKTQVATLLLTSNNPRYRWWVYLASASALTAAVLLEVTVGVHLSRFLSPTVFNRMTGVVFLTLAVISLWSWWRERSVSKSREVSKTGLVGERAAE